MVDTIVLRIHNVKKYSLLYGQFQVTGSKKNSYVEGYAVVDEDGVVTEKERLWQRMAFFEDSGKFLPYIDRFDINAPSNVYHVRGCIRNMGSHKAYLEVEFSLPKYFYGTNVFQLLGSPAKSSESNYFMLVKAIKRFMRDSFNQVPSDFDVEIFRIDLCYNQFHKSKDEAFKFMDVQSDWMKKYCDGKNMRHIVQPSHGWSIVTARYSFKAYHKGTEFYKGDYVKLVENLKKHNYNLSRLQSAADLIVRYEITFRNTMLHYLMMYYSFQDIEKKKGYLIENNLYSYLKRVQKRGSFSTFAAEQAGVKHRGEISPIEYFCNKQKKYTLKSEFDLPYTPMCVFSDNVSFNYQVYRLMYDFFWNKVVLSQPDEGVPVDVIADKISLYQERIRANRNMGLTSKSKVKKGNLREVAHKNTARILVPALLSQFVDIRTLKNHLPKATYHRLLLDFKRIGIPFKNGKMVVVKPPLDYSDNAALLEPMKKNFIL